MGEILLHIYSHISVGLDLLYSNFSGVGGGGWRRGKANIQHQYPANTYMLIKYWVIVLKTWERTSLIEWFLICNVHCLQVMIHDFYTNTLHDLLHYLSIWSGTYKALNIYNTYAPRKFSQLIIEDQHRFYWTTQWVWISHHHFGKVCKG